MKIAIVSKNRNQYSETFIHDHVNYLDTAAFFLHGGYLPEFYSGGWADKNHSFLTETPKGWFKKNNPVLINSGAHRTAIARFLKENQIEIVLAEYGPCGVEMMEICLATRTPFAVHFHGYDAYRKDVLGHYGKHYSRLFEKAGALIVVSEHMREQLKKLGAAENKIFLNAYGIDPALFHPSEKNIISNQFFAAGRFCETKSPHVTILAFAKMLTSAPGAKLLMAGDGHLLEACKILVRSLGITHSVEFLGVISPEEISERMRKSLAFVQHSLTTSENDTEGTPLAILEAGMSGRPVISTFHAGIPEAVAHEKTGFLVNEGEINEMANYMLKLYQNPELANEMGKAARVKISKEFSRKDKILSLNNILESVLKN